MGIMSPDPLRRPSLRSADYSARLRRRVWGASLLGVLAICLTFVALWMVVGQSVDTMLMEAVSLHMAGAQAMQGVTTGLVSWVNIVLASLIIALTAVARQRITLAGRALAIILISNVIIQALKWVLTRPYLGVAYVLPNSLPSGHVGVAASVALAMIVVSPEYLRSVVAWCGWLWIVLAGLLVMAQSWHRLSDVLVSYMIVGAVALVVSPVESQTRHFPVSQSAMSVVSMVALAAGALLTAAALYGVSVHEAASVSPAGYGFIGFLQIHPTRAALLAFGAVAWLVGVAGLVIHEVDRLRWPLASLKATPTR